MTNKIKAIIVIAILISSLGIIVNFLFPTIPNWVIWFTSLLPNFVAVTCVFLKTDNSVSVTFTASDWKKDEQRDAYYLMVPYKVHKKQHPIVSVYKMDEDGNDEEVGCDVEVKKRSEVFIYSNFSDFDGKVVIS